MFSEEYQEKIKEITQKARMTFRSPQEIALESENAQFYKCMSDLADKEFWTGIWCDLPYNEDKLVSLLQQFWCDKYEEVKDKIKG